MIIEIKAQEPTERQIKCFLQPGGKAFLAYSKRRKKNPVYKIKVCTVIEKDPIYIDLYKLEYNGKEFYKHSTDLGDSPEKAVQNYEAGLRSQDSWEN